MTAQPLDHPTPPPSPTAGAELLTRIAADRRADRWLPAFKRAWEEALAQSRQTYSLTPLHEVISEWSGRLDTAPAVDAFLASGMDDSDSTALVDVIGERR